MHIHVGLLHGFIVFLTVVVFGFFWRVIAAHNSQNALGQAMSFIY
jgi:hypothetical protein